MFQVEMCLNWRNANHSFPASSPEMQNKECASFVGKSVDWELLEARLVSALFPVLLGPRFATN